MISTDTNTYDFSTKVLKKWVDNRLKVESSNDELKVKFDVIGSTCSNMGWPIIFSMHLILKKNSETYRIQKAHLQFSEDKGFKKMCYFQTDNPSSNLLETAPFEKGNTLKITISDIRKQAPAGCLCTQKGRIYFWNIALQTTLFYLNNTNIKT